MLTRARVGRDSRKQAIEATGHQKGDKVIIPPQRDAVEYAKVYATKTGRRYVLPKELLERKSVKDQLAAVRKLETG